jgi:tetratricopeptide (TPR) repeat protein
MLGLALLDQLARQGIARTNPRWNDEAIAAVTRKVEQRMDQKKRAHALITLGKTLDWAGRLDEGYNLFLQASHILKDNSYNVLGELANSSVRRGKMQEAIAYYRKALHFTPDNVILHDNLAYYLEKNGDSQEALSHYYEIIRIGNASKQPTPVDRKIIAAHYNIAHIFSIQGRTKEAIDQYAEVLKLKPDEVSAHTNMGVLLAKEGETTEAITHFVAALKIKPDSSMAHYNLGMILDKQGKLDEAITHYSEVLRVEPDHAEAHNNLGVVFAKLGKIEEAVAQFSYAVKVNPGNAEAHYNLGMALAIQGKKEEADFHYSEAEKIRAEAAVPRSSNTH